MRLPLGLMSAALCVLGAGCGGADGPPYKPAASLAQLMVGPIQHSASTYWDAVSTVVDHEGIHEHRPQNDVEWTAVWSAAITLAESGNLLMMAGRARDDEWMRLAAKLVDTGMDAARAAQSKDPEKVLGAGEQIYNVCTECHTTYISAD
jgi:hypothetical protein